MGKLTDIECWLLREVECDPGTCTARRPWKARSKPYRAAWRLWFAGLITLPLFGIKLTSAGRKALQEQSHKHPPAASARGFPRKGTHLE